MMLYPHKYHIPIAADQDIQSVSTRIPVGLLKLTIVSASGLKPVESMSSDPYVQFTVCGTENKTQVVKNSIAPTWYILIPLGSLIAAIGTKHFTS